MYQMFVAAGVAAVGLAVVAVQPKHEEHHAKPVAADSPAGAVFEKLKALEGHWKGMAKGGEEEFPAEVIYKVSGAGSAVVETQFPGSAHEMITVYTLDGEAVRVTHYCAQGNQPRMKCTPAAGASALKFEFTDGGNMKSVEDPHMHSLLLTLVDADHLTEEWSFYEGGKAGHSAKFDLRRVKPSEAKEMETYYVVLLSHGPAWTPEMTPESAKIMEGHMAHIHTMSDAGNLRLAGPFADKSGGMFVMKADSAEAVKAMVDEDPAVKAGRLVAEIRPWLVEPGNIR